LYLHRGWKHFAHALDLQDDFSLVLRYAGWSQINIKVFDLTTCRKQYPHDFEAGGSRLSLPIMKPRSFAVILKKYHLKAKYLVSTRMRCRTYQRCRKLPLFSLSLVFFYASQRTCQWTLSERMITSSGTLSSYTWLGSPSSWAWRGPSRTKFGECHSSMGGAPSALTTKS